jgi:hypothetical protein
MSPPGIAELRANAVATGVLLGVMQWSVFFLLQSYLASTAVVFLLATAVWLAGGLAGMIAPGRHEGAWLGGAAFAFYLFRHLAVTHPYTLGALPVLLLLVAGMGAYGGRFFRCRAGLLPPTKQLFFLENTGFLGGMLLTATALFFVGEAWFTAGPALALGAVLFSGKGLLFRR